MPSQDPKFTFKFFTCIAEIGQNLWDKFAAKQDPFCRYTFLHNLEVTHCVGGKTGWDPQHLVIYQNAQPVGILPLYKKTHSYGEYVFDFAWANAYQEHGLEYYPKLISAIPFTPVTGPRLMTCENIDTTALLPELLAQLCEHLKNQLDQLGMSSMHWLFIDEQTGQQLAKHQQLIRRSVQFNWFNQAYTSFTHYLERFNSRKRKSVKKERAKVTEQGVAVKRLFGDALSPEHMQFFYQCYKQTYLKRSGHEGYLSQTFFENIYRDMGQNLLLVIAYKDQQPIASALFLYDENQLFGRYWGALEDISNLHFECCYYQGIEFCIEQNIQKFNPGTQGEHKILRGFEPTYCYSNHSLIEPAFHNAVANFIESENTQLAGYKQNAETLLPFKRVE